LTSIPAMIAVCRNDQKKVPEEVPRVNGDGMP